jgi:acetyl esterase/lipase
LLAHIGKDPDGFFLSRLPLVLQRFVRHHAKGPADAVVDLATALLPLVQPRALRSIRGETFELSSGVCLDVFRSAASSASSSPVLLFVHGGIWTLGNRRQYHSLGQRLAAEGFVGVVVGYTTWPRASAVAQARGVRSALRHAVAHAAEWGGDASRVYLSGQSSGANVAALALLDRGVAAGEAEEGGDGGLGGVACAGEGGVSCAGLVGMGGVYDVVEHFEHERRRGVEQASMLRVACDPLEDASPTRLVRDGGARLRCARALLLHGEKDITAPPSSSAQFALALARAGHDVALVPLPRDGHLSFLADLMLGRRCDVLPHLKRFCGVGGTQGGAIATARL